MRTRKLVAAFLMAACIAGCGGGGGGGGEQNQGAGPGPAPAVPAAPAVPVENNPDPGPAPVENRKPSTVANLVLSQPTDTSMVVSWTAPADSGSSAVSGYRVSWIERGTGRSWTPPTPYPPSASPLTLTGLVPATEYEVSVAAINAAGTGEARTAVLATLPAAGPVPPPPPPAVSRIVAGYYPNWMPAAVRIRDVHPRYNLIYLFHARPVGGTPGTTGEVYFDPPGDGRGAASNLVADIQHARSVQGRKIILSVGGAGNGMSFPNRQKSQNFVASIAALYDQLGGFDGMDWNTFEADQAPDTGEMIWISLELKRRFPGFIITAPPAPWSTRDMEFCRAMVAAGAMDYAAPQYYDGPGLASPSYVVSNAAQWISLLGQQHVVLGFGIWNEPNYMRVDEAADTWRQIHARFPQLRGVFNWEIHADEDRGWTFADAVGQLVPTQ